MNMISTGLLITKGCSSICHTGWYRKGTGVFSNPWRG